MNNPDTTQSSKHLLLKAILIFIGFILLETIALHFSSVLDLFGLYSMNITGFYYDNYMDVIFYNLILVNVFTAISFYMKAKYRLPFYEKTSRMRLIFSIILLVLILLLGILMLAYVSLERGTLFSPVLSGYQIFQYLFYVSASMLNMYMLCFVLIPAGIRSTVKSRWLSVILEILASCFAFSAIEAFDWMNFSFFLDQATLVLPVALIMVLSRKHYLSLPLFLFINVGLGIPDATTFDMKYFPWFLIIYLINIALIIFFSIKSKRNRDK